VLLSVSGLALLAVFAPREVNEETYFDGGGGPVWYAVLFAVILAVLAVGSIVAGSYSNEVWLANAGLLFAVLQIIGRFFDDSTTMLARSFSFLAAGALVLGLAWLLERRRPSLR